MELTRRDAVVALAVMGIGVGGTVNHLDRRPEVVDGMVAVAEVVYPSATSGIREFVQTFLGGRRQEEDYSLAEVESLLGVVDRAAKRETGSKFTALEPSRRDAVLRGVGAATAFPDPEGTRAERLRYYLVNDLLFALYSSPMGGKLVGNENPVGHPGGTEAYQQGPGNE